MVMEKDLKCIVERKLKYFDELASKKDRESILWRQIISTVILEFGAEDIHIKVIEYRFFKRYKIREVCDKLFISPNTYRAYEQKVINKILMHAASNKLILP